MAILFGFHAVTVRLKTAPQSVSEVHVDATRHDARMRAFVERAQQAGATIVDLDPSSCALGVVGVWHGSDVLFGIVDGLGDAAQSLTRPR